MCCCADEKFPSNSVQSNVAVFVPQGLKSQASRAPSAKLIVLPVLTLILMPKCPVCVAAYVMLFTGMSLSYAAAAGMRWLMIGISVAALVYLLVNATRRYASR